MRRSDPARGEEPVVGLRQRLDLARDLVDVVEDQHHTPQFHAQPAQRTREDVDVCLLDLARKQLVSDDERSCSRRRCESRHRASVPDALRVRDAVPEVPAPKSHSPRLSS